MTPDLSEPNDRMTESNYHALPKCLPECEAVPIQSERPNGDEVLECGCRYEDREVPYAQEFVPEIDCPIHGIAGTRYTVIAIASGVRLSAGSTVLDLSHTDAEALGSVLKAIARENRTVTR
jgi:hypothetical protein